MTFCEKLKMTLKQDGFAKCREIKNASAFETRSAPNLARCYLAALPSISEIPSLDSGTSSTDYRLTSNVWREKTFNSGYAIHSTHRCSSNRFSVTSGQSDSAIIIVRWRVVTANGSFGFGSARTKNITISLSNCGSRLATREVFHLIRRFDSCAPAQLTCGPRRSPSIRRLPAGPYSAWLRLFEKCFA